MKKVLRDNSLSIVFFLFFIITLVAQAVNGLKVYNEEMQEEGGQQVSFAQYLSSAHFVEATAKTGKVNFCKWVCSSG